MPAAPSISPQELVLGLASAVLLLWALVYVARSGLDRAFAPPSSDDDRNSLFANLPLRHESSQLPLVLSLFFHLFWASSLPWVEKFLPGQMPINWKKYDLVVVQFKPTDAKLVLPWELRRKQDDEEEEERRKRELGEIDDPGIGNLRPAPKSDETGGKDNDRPTWAHLEIVVPERPKPRREALDQSTPAPEIAVQLPQPALTNPAMAWEFNTPKPSEIQFPGTPSLAELQVERPRLATASSASAPMIDFLSPLHGMTPALANIAGAETLGSDGYSRLLVPQGGDRLLLADLFEGGFFGDGVGAAWGDGIWGRDEDGDGQGRGMGGLSPIPRQLHGIIMISTASASLPEAHGVLKGSPIYTVYLDAPGFRRKWIFQVCARENGSSLGVKNGVLKVVSRGTLDPPYALSKSPPEFSDLGSDPLPRRTVIYAAFDEEGSINDLRVVAGADPRTDEVLMASLKSWDFHPAFRDGRPVAVEALFGIPLR